jgi:hypothetical protein
LRNENKQTKELSLFSTEETSANSGIDDESGKELKRDLRELRTFLSDLLNDLD